MRPLWTLDTTIVASPVAAIVNGDLYVSSDPDPAGCDGSRAARRSLKIAGPISMALNAFGVAPGPMLAV